jgi:hypothetical protein
MKLASTCHEIREQMQRTRMIFKCYRLTANAGKQLMVEESQWKQMAEAVAREIRPVAEER